LPSHEGHQRDRGCVDSVEERAGQRRFAQFRQKCGRDTDVDECRQKHAQRREHRAFPTCKKITNKCSHGEKRSWRSLAYSHGIQQLRIGEPVESHYQVGAQDGQQHVAAAYQECSNFQKIQEDGKYAQRSACAAASQADPRAESRAVGNGPLPFTERHPEESCANQQPHRGDARHRQHDHNHGQRGERHIA
jgi:hypothetical protein